MSLRGDVIIVGAGISGLACARKLVAGGATVRVLEARDRVGGRTESATVGKGTFDLGGQWLGPSQRRMHALVEELGIATFPTYHAGRRVLEVDGKRTTYKGMIPSLSIPNLLTIHSAMRKTEKLRAAVPPGDPLGSPHAVSWDAETVETWKKKLLRFAAGRGVFDVAVRVVFGAEPAELSLLFFLYYLNQGGGLESLVEVERGAQETRFVPGAQEVSKRLAAPLGDRVTLNVPVLAIEQTDHEVIVKTPAGEARGARVILAVPPTLAGRILYTPALPYERDQLTQRWPMGATIKALATYERPFWREAGLSGEAVSTDSLVSATFDNTSHDGAQPALLGFLVGKHARVWGARPAAARREAVLAAFARFFGNEAARPVDYVEKDWQAEPWTRGCPTGAMPPGVMSQFASSLRAPVGRVHFAGTETATEWTGYMEGAVEAGERAAKEVLAAR